MSVNKKDIVIDNHINTECANNFASSRENSLGDIKLNWGEYFSNYRVKKWRKELKKLSESTGIRLEEVCEYIGVDVSAMPGFYKKLPKKRDTYIGIGMAFRQPLDTINRWLNKYGMKRKLYVKDILSDLIWIHLIEVNFRHSDSKVNYFKEFNNCKSRVESDCLQIWSTIPQNDETTVKLKDKLQTVPYDSDHFELSLFVKENIDAFKSAYARPRRLLKTYVDQILETKNKYDTKRKRWTLNSLRGYLDDSMINYLSGDYETVNKSDTTKIKGVMGIKYIPKSKKAHISLCLALGMGVEEINDYLQMMGYSALDAVDLNEGQLINMLFSWEESYPLVQKYKDKHFKKSGNTEIGPKEELEAVNQMLQLREDLKEKTNTSGNDEITFPYLSD